MHHFSKKISKNFFFFLKNKLLMICFSKNEKGPIFIGPWGDCNLFETSLYTFCKSCLTERLRFSQRHLCVERESFGHHQYIGQRGRLANRYRQAEEL
jgi:hypothetical protein